MSSVFWEMWNENHGKIDEKVWVNQKTKKIKDKIRVCDLYLIEAENTMPRETKSHKTEINSYQIEAVRFSWSSSSMRFLWALCFLSFRLSTREWYCVCWLCSMLSFKILLWAEKCEHFGTKLACSFFSHLFQGCFNLVWGT